MHAAPSGKTIRMVRTTIPQWQNEGVSALRLRSFLLLVVAILLGPGVAAAAPPAGPPRVRAELVSEVDAAVPGRTLWIGLSQQIAPGWHTYWINPGDSGEPTSIEWEAPPGVEIGEIAWPHPD